MDNLSHGFAHKLGVWTLATVLMLGTFSITLFSFDQNDLDEKLGVVKGVAIVNESAVVIAGEEIPAVEEEQPVDGTVEEEMVEASVVIVEPEFECKEIKNIERSPRGDKYFEKLGLDTSKHPEILRYQIQWSTGTWSDWYVPTDEDWKDNCGDKYYLGNRTWDPDRPAECARYVWSYFTDHNHKIELCMDNFAISSVDPSFYGLEIIDDDKDDEEDKVKLPDLKPYSLNVNRSKSNLITGEVSVIDNETGVAEVVDSAGIIDVNIIIKNIGQGEAGPSTYKLSWTGDHEKTGEVPTLAAGEKFKADMELVWSNPEHEKVWFELTADANNEVEESNEKNNTHKNLRRFIYRRCLNNYADNSTTTIEQSGAAVRYCLDEIKDWAEEKIEEKKEEVQEEKAEAKNQVQEQTKKKEYQADFTDGQMGMVEALQARIKKLERQVSDLERQVIEREKNLVKAVNKALTQRLRGKILLQVEGNGEAWYVDETTEERFYLKDGEAAYEALQVFGLGISNEDLESIPIGVEDRAEKVDTDNDGLDDKLEEAIGTDPADPDTDDDGYNDGEEVKSDNDAKGQNRKQFRQDLADRLEGKILLQVEGNGEAWYVHNGRRHYLKDGRLAYQIMRYLSLGITNDDLRQIPVGELE